MSLKKLQSPVISLAGVGPRLEQKLHNIGIFTIQDLLFHLPYRYLDRTQIAPIGGLVPGSNAYIEGRIAQTQIIFGKRRSLLCRIEDGTGALLLRFFHFNKYQQARLAEGSTLRCWGQVRRGPRGLEMIHPEYQQVENDEELEQTLTPVYPATDGLAQARLRKLTAQALAILDRDRSSLEELVPEDLLSGFSFPSLSEAIHYIHRPPQDVDVDALLAGRHPAQVRLIFEELLAHQTSIRVLRRQIRTHAAYAMDPAAGQLEERFLEQLPFRLTASQEKVLKEITGDLSGTVPMLRLVQGDVGSGKTVIAALAAIRAVTAGLQVVLMAPTELLADQHFMNLQNWLSGLDIKLCLLTGKTGKAVRRELVSRIETESPLVIVGTHALFQEGIRFSRLGLVIIDEQHRFGVHQRLSLIEKGSTRSTKPHQLIMTATPIPRTLAMSLFAELDVSTIDELPPGRQPVSTAVLSNQKRETVIQRISDVCDKGQQAYWVCPLIEESDVLECQAAVTTHETLREVLPNLDIGLIHGRLKPNEKEAVMERFKSGKTQLLVATSVIEVGVDVPNASLMIIENAERMGLSQLHQLRGRIGRGDIKSHCVLLYQSPLSESARDRLEAMRNSSDGFVLAEKDLELRGPGDVIGTRQTGMPQMQIANLARDAAYLPRVRQVADRLVHDYPGVPARLAERWLSSRIEYAKV